jgi:putative oxidoreductase
MDNQHDVERPPVTLAGTAPVAMQRGRHGDRIVAARLRAQRRWLIRDQDKAGLIPDPPATDVALLLLRAVVGISFLAHAAQKLDDLARFERAFAAMGIPAPELMVPFVSATEIVCGLLLIAGLATPLAALALAGNMVVAFFTAHVSNGFFAEQGGFEVVLLLGAGCVALTLSGAGRYSLDAALGVRLRLART